MLGFEQIEGQSCQVEAGGNSSAQSTAAGRHAEPAIIHNGILSGGSGLRGMVMSPITLMRLQLLPALYLAVCGVSTGGYVGRLGCAA